MSTNFHNFWHTGSRKDKLCDMHLFSTSLNSRQRPTVLMQLFQIAT